ncbi:MAG: Stk1 family PASTA domain-containing Ser/Thr kinase [Lachnospiraceae bacterium]|nr:Stk1 family PASTA domain-containing Ser/Thr kinase [Lachnospiraceae bacterium]
MLNPGTMLGDRYEILEKIGAGGMADVYKAKDHKLNRYDAVKVLKDEFSSNKSFVSKFRAEAQAAAGLMHPNIVNVYDVGDENGLYYFVMELVEGITLKRYIEKKISLSVKEAVSIAIQVSMGIESAHNNGIIHRDIKPQNIIISKEGKVKVADFGIARAASSDTQTSHAMGSVHYTSPEQARGGYSDAKSDIYSIGITLFEMVTGRVPFDGETTVAIAIKHIQEEMPSPKIYVPEIPVSVEQIIFKCTQKNPDRRYSNVSELMADLKRSLISPDENFVVIQDAASSEGTKALTDEDRREIRQQTSSSLYGNDSFEAAYSSYNQRQYGGYDEPQQYGYDYDGQYQGNNNYDEQYYPNDAYKNDEYNDQMYSQSYDSGYSEGYNDAGEDYVDPYYVMDPRAKGTPIIEDTPVSDQADGLRAKQSRSYSNKNEQRSSNGGSNKKKQNGNKQNKTGNKRYAEEDLRRKNTPKQTGKGRQDYYNEPDKYDDEDDVDPKMENIMTVLMIIAAIILAIVAVFIVSKVLDIGSLKEDETVIEEGMTEVPKVVGLSIADAELALKNAGLTAKASYAESTMYDKDYIDSQDPAAGTIVEENSVLTLVVSSGKVGGASAEGTNEETPVGGAAVPDVVGKSEAEARVAIEKEGFVFASAEQPSESVDKGKVISQSPLGATNAPLGSSIQVYISTGGSEKEEEEEGDITVPNVVGKDEATARALLIEAGLKCTNATEQTSDTVAVGNVISQSLTAGSKAAKDTNVDLIVSKGPSGYTCNCTIQAPEGYLVGSEAIIVLLDANAAELQRFTTNTFPYTAVKTGITSTPAGVITVTYQTADGQWQTSAPTAVAFTKE